MSTATGVHVAAMEPEHATAVLEIYRLGIDEQNATFETAAPAWEAFDAAKLPEHRFVALDANGQVVGWAAVVPVSDRCAYAGVVEHSVYVHPDARGGGVGLALLTALIASTEAAGIWTIQSGIFPRTPPASPCISGPGSGSSAHASASAATTAKGATWSWSNAAARPSAEPPHVPSWTGPLQLGGQGSGLPSRSADGAYG